MTLGRFFLHRPLSMSRKHNKLDETIPPAINKAAALLAEAMRQENVTRKEMAERLKTSGAQVDRLLNPNHNPSLSSLSRAAAIVGRQVKLTLIRRSPRVDDQLKMVKPMPDAWKPFEPHKNREPPGPSPNVPPTR